MISACAVDAQFGYSMLAITVKVHVDLKWFKIILLTTQVRGEQLFAMCLSKKECWWGKAEIYSFILI